MIILRPEDPWPVHSVKNPATGVPEEIPYRLLELVHRAHVEMVYQQPPDQLGPLWLLLGPRGRQSLRQLREEYRGSFITDARIQPGSISVYGMKVLYVETDIVEIVREWVS